MLIAKLPHLVEFKDGAVDESWQAVSKDLRESLIRLWDFIFLFGAVLLVNDNMDHGG